MSTPAIRAMFSLGAPSDLTLLLLVLRVRANDHDRALSADHFAALATRFDGCSDLHETASNSDSSLSSGVGRPVGSPTVNSQAPPEGGIRLSVSEMTINLPHF